MPQIQHASSTVAGWSAGGRTAESSTEEAGGGGEGGGSAQSSHAGSSAPPRGGTSQSRRRSLPQRMRNTFPLPRHDSHDSERLRGQQGQGGAAWLLLPTPSDSGRGAVASRRRGASSKGKVSRLSFPTPSDSGQAATNGSCCSGEGGLRLPCEANFSEERRHDGRGGAAQGARRPGSSSRLRPTGAGVDNKGKEARGYGVQRRGSVARTVRGTGVASLLAALGPFPG